VSGAEAKNIAPLISWLPLIIAIISIVGGVIVSNTQKAIDRRHQVLLDRRIFYREVLEILRKGVLSAVAKDPQQFVETYEQLYRVESNAMLSCPDPVIKKLRQAMEALLRFQSANAVENSSAESTSSELGQYNEKFEQLVSAMRADTFSDTKVEGRLSFSAFGFSVGINK
jgi:hypothetical protein